MHEATKLALDLEEQIPQEHRDKAAITDVIADLFALSAAVKAQDWKSAWAAFVKLLNDLTPQQVGAHAGLNWQGIFNIIGKLLPLIWGGLAGA